MHIRKVNAFMPLFLSALIILPASGHSLTLQEAVLSASIYDSEISAARNAQRADSQKRLQGFASLLPVISLNGSYIKQDQPKATYAAGVTRHTYSLNLTQPLFDIAKYAAWKRGDAIANYADVVLMLAEQKLITRVAEAYFRVIYQRDVLKSAINAKAAYGKQLSQTEVALKVGEGTRLERDEAQANYDRAIADEIAAKNDLQEAGIIFSRLTGRNPDEIQPVVLSCIMRFPVSDDFKALEQQAGQNNLQVRAALFQLEQTKADLIAAHGAHLPVVTLQAGYGTNWSKAEDSNLLDYVFGTTSKTRSSNIGINVSIPLFAGGSQISQSVEAVRRREQGKDLLEDARRKARQETQSAWLKLKNGQNQYLAEKKALASAKNKVNSTAYGRKVGLRTIIDELNAEQEYYKSLQALAKLQYEYLNARLKLSVELGELDYSQLDQYRCAGDNKKSPLIKQGR
ncbi:TolC family outer membrane protein [Pantoea alhagi]|uniref:TolC family outer membrane protein n=1 Tax=Pantoea alhagi TaxID=1891675 RepID=UPI00202ADF7F|nr:TolC family outer membrane protein [Pantoea alhagi]URQ60809.1 TolC family outer membrane protein [Pantoea alhagi]